MVSFGEGHEIRPLPDTCYTIYGLRADLLDPRDYPVEAVCANCPRPIRREAYINGEWEHFTREGIVINDHAGDAPLPRRGTA